MSLTRRLIAEGLGTALLTATVIGSGIMAERLCGGNGAVALLANALATGAGLFAFITVFAPVSGAHFNPVVTLHAWRSGEMGGKSGLGYIASQFAGAFAGVTLANLMFAGPAVSLSRQFRTGPGQWLGEAVATFGLLTLITGCARKRPAMTPLVVAAYIVAAYWFTSSTSFANPALTFGRMFSDTFAGIRPADVAGFVLAQLAGGLAASFIAPWLFRDAA